MAESPPDKSPYVEPGKPASIHQLATGFPPGENVKAVSESILQEAERIINGQRQVDYGSARESFDRIGALWEQVLGHEVSAEQVALCLIQLKVSRAIQNLRSSGAVQRDSIVDIAGYAGCLEKVQNELA